MNSWKNTEGITGWFEGIKQNIFAHSILLILNSDSHLPKMVVLVASMKAP